MLLLKKKLLSFTDHGHIYWKWTLLKPGNLSFWATPSSWTIGIIVIRIRTQDGSVASRAIDHHIALMGPCSTNEHQIFVRWSNARDGRFGTPVVGGSKNCWREGSGDVARVNIISLHWHQCIPQSWENVEKRHGSLPSYCLVSCQCLLSEAEGDFISCRKCPSANSTIKLRIDNGHKHECFYIYMYIQSHLSILLLHIYVYSISSFVGPWGY